MTQKMYPTNPNVGSLCINCDFCTYSDAHNTVELYDRVRIPRTFFRWLLRTPIEYKYVTEVLCPGTYICSNPKSEQHEGCVVGHLGCRHASQLNATPEWQKTIAVKGAWQRANTA